MTLSKIVSSCHVQLTFPTWPTQTRKSMIAPIKVLLKQGEWPAAEAVNSANAPPHSEQRAQQTNQSAACGRGGGVTQVHVTAVEGEAGEPRVDHCQVAEVTLGVFDTLAVNHASSRLQSQAGVVLTTVLLFVAAPSVVIARVASDGQTETDQGEEQNQSQTQGALHFHCSSSEKHRTI